MHFGVDHYPEHWPESRWETDAAPPAWIIEANPEILPVDSSGITRGFGGRHHDCQSNPTYRAHVERIVTAMADHYDHPHAVAGAIHHT